MYREKSRCSTLSTKAGRLVLWGLAWVAVFTVPIGLAACGSSSGTQAGANEKPKILVVGCDGAPYTTFNALQEGAYYSIEENVYERLCAWDDAAQKAIPQVAESWEASPDCKTWTFHIRQGTKFHDGADVDAAAVKASLELSQQVGLQSVATDAIDAMEATDKYTLVMHLKYPQKMDMGATSLCGMSVLDVAGIEKYGDKAFTPGYDLGSGPYRLTAATTSEVRFERYKEYCGGWQGEKAKCPDVAIFRGIGEPAARVQNLEQGSIQIMFGVLPEDAERLRKNDAFTVYANDVWALCCYVLNTKKAPLSDPNLREALYWSYPYEQVLKLAVGGEGTIASGPIAVGVPGYEEQLARFGQPTQDMAKARAALALSKYPQGNITLDCPVEMGKAWEMQAVQLWKTALAELGIRLNAHLANTSVTLEQAWSDNPPQDMVAGSWMKTTAFPYGLHYTQITDIHPVWNLSYWSDPEVTKLVMEGISLYAEDEEAGIDKMNDAWAIALEAHPTMYTVDVKAISAAAKTIQGFNGSQAGSQNSLNCYSIGMN